MQKNRTYWIIILFVSILLLDMLVLYLIYNKKPTPYMITQQTATPLTLKTDINEGQIFNNFYYYTQTSEGIKFYNLKGDLILDKVGNFSIFDAYDASGKYLISSGKSLFILDLKTKEMNEILTAGSEIMSATISSDKNIIDYSIISSNKNTQGKVIKTPEIWQYDLLAKTNKLLISDPLSSNNIFYLLGWTH